VDTVPELGPSAFRLFTADEFKFKLTDLPHYQVCHLSESVPKEHSAFTKIGMDELLSYGDKILSVLTEFQVEAMKVTQEERDWIKFRREAARLKYGQEYDSARPFEMCLNMENKECLVILGKIIADSPEDRQEKVADLFKYNEELRTMRWELLSGHGLLKAITKDQFDSSDYFVVNHDGQKYDLQESLNLIETKYASLAAPGSTVSLVDAFGDGPTRAWIGQLNDTMKSNMISDYNDYDASIQKFKFPIKGSDGFYAGFMAGKTLQKGLTLPFALDPRFYELTVNVEEGEIEAYFKNTYAHELKMFHDINLFQNLEGDGPGLSPEQEEQVKQIEQDQSKTPEEKTKEIEKLKKVARFNYNKEEGDFAWAPLNELTFNGFGSESNYNNYDIPRGGLTFDEWDTKNKAVYSEFDYYSTGEYYEQFYERCITEFKEFVKTFRSGLEQFLEMPDVPVTHKEHFSTAIKPKLDLSPMNAEDLLQKIVWENDDSVNSWYGKTNASTVFKTFMRCLNPKQLSKFVAVWTGAASTKLVDGSLKAVFYHPKDNDTVIESYMTEEQNESVSSSIVIHGGAEYKEFIQKFSEKLGQEANATETIDPFSDGKEHPEYWPSKGSATCFKILKMPIQSSRGMVEALIYLLNDDPSNLMG
jgi:hypothetical protein